MSKCWINGELVEETQATISIRDTGLLHGAGLFTTMRVQNGKPIALDRHLARLRRSSDALFVPLPYKDEQLQQAITDLLQANELTEARLRLTVTRGAMDTDPVHGLRFSPIVFISATKLEGYPADWYEKGITVIAYDRQKLNPYDMQAGHKTLDYFSRFAGLREATGKGAGEALWFNVHNYLQSGSVSNVFLVRDGRLLTPPTQADLSDEAVQARCLYPRSNALPGVTRSLVLELARANGIEVDVVAIDIDMALSANECFLTNSIMGLMPVCRIEAKALGEEKPGDLTRKLVVLYRKHVDELVSRL